MPKAEEKKSERNLTDEQIALIKSTVVKDATEDELRLFLYQCQRTGLDPLTRQIYVVKRWDKHSGRTKMTIQTSIDGFRLIAERTKNYGGQTTPEWCADDGIWRDVWIPSTPPSAARIGVWRLNFKEPTYGVAKFASYAVRNKNGDLNEFWSKMPEVMISKVAEALALRKAFPQELSGLYTSEEMDQAGEAAIMERQAHREEMASNHPPGLLPPDEPSRPEREPVLSESPDIDQINLELATSRKKGR